jgi:hypothetical protein
MGAGSLYFYEKIFVEGLVIIVKVSSCSYVHYYIVFELVLGLDIILLRKLGLIGIGIVHEETKEGGVPGIYDSDMDHDFRHERELF